MNCDDLNDVDIDECVNNNNIDNNNEKVEKNPENVKLKFTIFGYPYQRSNGQMWYSYSLCTFSQSMVTITAL
jgi:hypothetical protein